MNSNPSIWESVSDTCLKIFVFNCQSLKPKLRHIQSDPIAMKADVLCLSETWLMSDTLEKEMKINSYETNLNSIGKGKGLATYYNGFHFHFDGSFKTENFQLTKLSSARLDVISVYLSDKVNSSKVVESLMKLIDFQKHTILCGDFNICFKQDSKNKLIIDLERLGFKQLVMISTHIQGGLIDHVYLLNAQTEEVKVDVSLHSPYYGAKDHDALLINVTFI